MTPQEDAVENLMWRAYTHGIRAMEVEIQSQLPWLNIHPMWEKFMMDRDSANAMYNEWKARTMNQRDINTLTKP